MKNQWGEIIRVNNFNRIYKEIPINIYKIYYLVYKYIIDRQKINDFLKVTTKVSICNLNIWLNL